MKARTRPCVWLALVVTDILAARIALRAPLVPPLVALMAACSGRSQSRAGAAHHRVDAGVAYVQRNRRMSEVLTGRERDGRAMGGQAMDRPGAAICWPAGRWRECGASRIVEARAECRLVADQAAWNRPTRRAGDLGDARAVKWLAARPELRLGRARTSYGGTVSSAPVGKSATGRQ
jgi:hypothetical protein